MVLSWRILLATCLGLFVLPAATGCDSSKERLSLVAKAKAKIADCKTTGDKPFKKQGKYLVWDLKNDSVHAAQRLLDAGHAYRSGEGPVTVFLVTGKQSQQMGVYSISKQPAYREWMEVYAIRFSGLGDAGVPLAAHEVVSLDPRHRRPVQHNPEYGNPNPPIADWIRAIPTEP